MTPTEKILNELNAEDFLKEKISVDYLINLDLIRRYEIKRGFR